MSREIKFRGMLLSGWWAKGNLTIVKEGGPVGVKPGHYISNSVGCAYAYQVRPETVGQFTGLKDKNGVDIYEGDICVREDGEKCHVIFYANSWCMDMSPYYPMAREGWCERIQAGCVLEVVGNIHEKVGE